MLRAPKDALNAFRINDPQNKFPKKIENEQEFFFNQNVRRRSHYGSLHPNVRVRRFTYMLIYEANPNEECVPFAVM